GNVRPPCNVFTEGGTVQIAHPKALTQLILEGDDMLRRKWLVAGVAGSLGATGVVLLAASLVWVPKSSAQQGKEPRESRADKVGQLPIAQVVLFSSGVGYFQREGTVEGNTRVDLSFPVQDVNDLLKSMVVRDLDGGVISTVSYDSNAPVERTLKSF